ncbi:phosphate regulon sensor histidine kinase PhoR [Thiomicrorhabdus sp. zzn3]|uniref:phosphate regulon sensor histidine kinase PhoR n=1 Tax=Thiomicrorhabdus sp. zzn3 TaxID=3039775 RepID=UPI0024367193|nr:phosphate regulon sensor histidine kinase PhoR [Thiomicrorhabdus sp. zzn3]MDG6777465.1 phosphate regulon sensor histidine kinase PhoR [Thiomicrorhabdus sp. zzn3]
MFSSGVTRELTWVITTLWLLLFFCWLTDWWVESLIAYLVLYIFRQLWSMRKFEKWIEGGTVKAFPPASGFWSQLTYLVSRKQRALEKHADLQLYKSEQFKSASMLIPDAIVSLDQENHIEWFNASSAKILELRRQDVGRKIEGLIRQPEFIHYLKDEQYQDTLTIHSLQGVQRTFSVRVIPYFDSHKLLIVKDITELYNLAQIRRDFIANASHELRTPLTVLKGYLEAMIDTPGEHQKMWAPALQNMQNQSDRMQAIIEDLLTLSKMESETFSSEVEVVDVPAMLTRLRVEVEQLSQGQHQFSFHIDQDLKLKGYAEPLKSVFMNLVSNAVRYTPEQGRIEVRWFSDSDGAHFEVEDNGIGIAKEHIPRLTERFYRVDTARSRATGGTGLGLAIVKHVLERHQATLHVDSLIGRGSIFSCNFPVQRVVHQRSDSAL